MPAGARLGGVYGSDAVTAPYVAGHDGVGVIEKVGPGVKELHVGDVVLPLHTFMGTWQSKVGFQSTKKHLKVKDVLSKHRYYHICSLQSRRILIKCKCNSQSVSQLHVNRLCGWSGT